MFLAHHAKVVDDHDDEGKACEEQEAQAVAILGREIDKPAHEWRKDETSKGPETTYPAIGTAHALTLKYPADGPDCVEGALRWIKDKTVAAEPTEVIPTAYYRRKNKMRM